MEKELLVKEAQDRFQRLHAAIFAEVSAMLRKAKLMPLVKLENHKPTFAELVDELRNLRNVVDKLSQMINERVNLADIDQYIGLADKLAKAIDKGCHDSLGAAIAELDEKPYI
ncbi:hypothetical protein CWI84_06375 [Idiomarina tyrosinivorans]|uniref:Uncharacterized protein n=1 Tax=Idiomarina tyrosinivorans TaxID=1445662 RepID=A0A432ZQR6_9GAMM|nr:hypothetical protein [Idiomarina tyrosinivorans]RUO80254.1 hypothetical protein CWI84_06375 [Idiomarina tyrosinivorans]